MDKNLFEEFAPVSKTKWIEKIEKDLKGKSLQELQWNLGNDLSLEALYHREDLSNLNSPILNKADNNWEIGDDVILKNLPDANAEAHYLVKNGIDSPRFILNKNLAEKGMKTLLAGLNPDDVAFHFYQKNPASSPIEIIQKFHEVIRKRGLVTLNVEGSLSIENSYSEELNFYEMLQFTNEVFPKFKCITINCHSFFNGAENILEELSNSILEGSRAFQICIDQGIKPEIIQQHLQFSISIGENYFASIAKIRALRMLWNNILAAYGLENSKPLAIDCHFAPSAQTEDANTNKIQNSTQAMAAIIAGVNRLTVLPSDSFQKNGNSDFERRIARNVQHVLKKESYFDRVVDPTTGSYFFENFTQQIAEKAWNKFQVKFEA